MRERALKYGAIFDLLEHYTPEQRQEVFYEIEHRWCWVCGQDAVVDNADGTFCAHDCQMEDVVGTCEGCGRPVHEDEEHQLWADGVITHKACPSGNATGEKP